MSLDRNVKRFMDLLAASRPPRVADSSVAQRRAGLQQLMQFSGVSPTLESVEDRMLPGPQGPLGVRVYAPAASRGRLGSGLIYFHGGGLVAGTLDTHDWIARMLAASGQCRVVSVAYRLAPEHLFPAAFDDALAASVYIAAHALEFGIEPARLGICGDSAGGTLAAAVCHAMASLDLPRLALQLLICPILDYGGATPSRHEFAEGYLISEALLTHDLRHGLPAGTDVLDERISPLRAESLAGVPPTIVHTAQYDPLRDEGREYFERLVLDQRGVAYTCHPGMVHLFYALGRVVPYAYEAFEQLGSEIRAGLH